MNQEVSEVIEKQVKVVEYINNHEVSNLQGDDISRMIIVLSTNNVFLGQHIANLDYEVTMKEAIRKGLWSDRYIELRKSEVKITQKDSEIDADQSVKEMVLEEIESKRILGKIKNLRMDCKELVSSLQSRLNQLKQERIDASMVPNPK